MEIKGKVLSFLPMQTGEGKNGQWKKQDFILEITSSKYPKKVCISIWGNKIDEFKLKEGEEISAMVDIESKEFNGRWFTNVQAWSVKRANQGGEQQDDFSAQFDGVDNVPDEEVPF